MDESNKELFEGMELSDEMLEGISGGMELPEIHKLALRNAVARQKLENWSESDFVEFLTKHSPWAHYPDMLAAFGCGLLVSGANDECGCDSLMAYEARCD